MKYFDLKLACLDKLTLILQFGIHFRILHDRYRKELVYNNNTGFIRIDRHCKNRKHSKNRSSDIMLLIASVKINDNALAFNFKNFGRWRNK